MNLLHPLSLVCFFLIALSLSEAKAEAPLGPYGSRSNVYSAQHDLTSNTEPFEEAAPVAEEDEYDSDQIDNDQIDNDQIDNEQSDAEQNDNEQSDDAQSDEAQSDDKQSSDDKAPTLEATRNARRLSELRKPLTGIRVNAVTSAEESPSNVARELLRSSDEIWFSGTGQSVPGPNRYTLTSYHRPLYFEQLNLERCGDTYGCATNLVSGIQFLTNTAMLPYRLATERPDVPVCSHGDCLTCQAYECDIEPFGFESKGALVEAAAIAGFIFLAM